MIENFYEILNKGWVPTVRKGSTGIGATFESLMGISENQKSEPDYKGIEIKTRRSSSVYFTTLFNLTPAFSFILLLSLTKIVTPL